LLAAGVGPPEKVRKEQLNGDQKMQKWQQIVIINDDVISAFEFTA